MKRIIAVLSVLIFSSLLVSAYPRNVNACSCVWPESVDKALNDASAVFSGKVMDIKIEKTHDGYSYYAVVFQTKRIWKGEKQKEIIVKTGPSNCSYVFNIGDEYLIYGNNSDWLGGLETGICTYTKPLNVAEEDLAILGKGKSPNGVNIYITSSSLLIVSIVGFLFYKKRKR